MQEEPSVTLGGYELTLSAPVRAKALEQMTTQRMINRVGQTRKQYIEDSVKQGATVGEREGQRALVFPDGSYMRQSEITKTALDYADYLSKAPSRITKKGTSRITGRSVRITRKMPRLK